MAPIARVAGSHRVGSFWRRLTDLEREAFINVAQVRRYDTGTVLIHAAHQDQWAAVLHSGRVRVISADASRSIAQRWAGDIIGEQSLLDHGVRSATIRAETSVLALIVGRQDFDRIADRYPRVLRVLGAVVSERLREADLNLSVQRNDAFTRVAERLLRNAVELEIENRPGTPIGIGSQAAFGESLGLSRESVVRALKSLRDNGAITTDRGVVIIKDMARLRAAAGR